MEDPKHVCGIILCSGKGKRFNHELPKQFHHLSGKKIYLHTLEKFVNCQEIDSIVLVIDAPFIDIVKSEIESIKEKKIILTKGAEQRQLSSFQGLCACPDETTHVVIHDGVRPFVDQRILDENIKMAILYKACDTCIFCHDTLIQSIDGNTIDTIPERSHYLRGQTPQSFSYDLIFAAHKQAQENHIFQATDDCQLVLKMGHEVKIVQGDDRNIKITTEYDLLLAEQIQRLHLKKTDYLSSVSLKNKVFVVTGGHGDIGSAICKDLILEGAFPVPLSKSSPDELDLSDPQQAKKAFEKLYREYGAVEGLINCCGYLQVAPLDSLSIETIETLIRSNFHATLYSCLNCALKKGGHILNFSSSSYSRGRKDYVLYSAMKAAIVNFTQGLALERPELQINCIIPSRTKSTMREKNFPFDERSSLLECSEISKEVINILKSEGLTGNLFDIKKK